MAMVLTLAAGACDDGTSEGTSPVPTGDASGSQTAYERDLEPLLIGCTGCHGAGLQESELDLRDPWASIDLPAKQAAMALIVEGSHVDSYLWHKVNGSHGVAGGAGGRMPAGSQWTEAQIQLLADWIDAGCPQ